ncbi:MAG TPA: hypothetical protein DCS93_04250 [Microscillaceae bacterium]|nr:hypothetical protein [Microscillaceae bacterium]
MSNIFIIALINVVTLSFVFVYNLADEDVEEPPIWVKIPIGCLSVFHILAVFVAFIRFLVNVTLPTFLDFLLLFGLSFLGIVIKRIIEFTGERANSSHSYHYNSQSTTSLIGYKKELKLDRKYRDLQVNFEAMITLSDREQNTLSKILETSKLLDQDVLFHPQESEISYHRDELQSLCHKMERIRDKSKRILKKATRRMYSSSKYYKFYQSLQQQLQAHLNQIEEKLSQNLDFMIGLNEQLKQLEQAFNSRQYLAQAESLWGRFSVQTEDKFWIEYGLFLDEIKKGLEDVRVQNT